METDLHSHILPGIDDGARTLDESVEMVRELADLGVRRVVATPHYMVETIYTSPRKENLKLVRKLQKRLDAEGILVEVLLGNEIYINEQIEELVSLGLVAPLDGSEYLLVELPMSGEYPGYKDILAELMSDGFKVILAHPERYATVQEDFGVVEELYDAGVLLQCNLGSFAGQYGKSAQKVAEKLVASGMVFGFGSDIHRVRGEKYWRKVRKKLRKHLLLGE